MRFELRFEPPTVTAQEKGLAVRIINGKPTPIAFEKDKVKAARNIYRYRLMRYAPEKPLEGPLRLVTEWTWKAQGRHKPGDYRDTKPDTDNLIKLFKDAMGDCKFFNNDSQIVYETTIKRWGIQPGIKVVLEKIGRESE